MKYESELKKIIQSDNWMISILKQVRKLELPDCWIGAGFVRNKVWDVLHQQTATPLNDIDVIYFDLKNTSKENDIQLEEILKQQEPNINWSVKNQARMHLKHGHAVYANCEKAISFWPETATAVAIRLNANNQLEHLAPYGLEDLFQLKVRHSPKSNYDAFLERLDKKKWEEIWNRLVIEREKKPQHY